MRCSRDRSLFTEPYSIPGGCSLDGAMDRRPRQTSQGRSLASAAHLATHPSGLLSHSLKLTALLSREKTHPDLALEVPAVVLAKVPSRPQSPTSSRVLLNEDSFGCHETPITDLSHLHTESCDRYPLPPGAA